MQPRSVSGGRKGVGKAGKALGLLSLDVDG